MSLSYTQIADNALAAVRELRRVEAQHCIVTRDDRGVRRVKAVVVPGERAKWIAARRREGATLEELGHVLGLTRERVRQIQQGER